MLTYRHSTVTETSTAVESAVATALFTETTTETASTEVLLYTESTTITASAETDVLTESTTLAVTVTAVSTAPGITSTSTVYQYVAKARRSVSSSLPAYASTVCPSWDKYVSACKCAGAAPTTITVPALPVTVTVPASSTATSVVSTLSSTQTDVISVTATTSSTQTDTISLTTTLSTSTTAIISSTSTTSSTATPTTIIPLYCRSTGTSFRVTAVLAGSTRYMNVVSTVIAWQTTPVATGPQTYSYTWTLDANGFFQTANPIGTAVQVTVPYIDLSAAGASASTVPVASKLLADVQAGVATGKYSRLKGCVNAATGEVTISGAGSRYNILDCGNQLFMSNGTGVDWKPNCATFFPTGTQV